MLISSEDKKRKQKLQTDGRTERQTDRQADSFIASKNWVYDNDIEDDDDDDDDDDKSDVIIQLIFPQEIMVTRWKWGNKNQD